MLEKGFNSDELFNGSNTNDLEDENYVIVDEKGNPVSSKKPTAPFEELHCSECDKFLVPLFVFKGDERSFLGNGVIVDNFLITAAHVAVCSTCRRSIHRIYYRIEREYIEVNDEMLIHDGRDPYGRLVHDVYNYHDDLIIYELNVKYNSFKLSDEPVQLDDEFALWPYERDSKNEGVINPRKSVCRVTAINNGRLGKKTYDWQNCFIVENNSQIISGHSGSALFINDTVCGIIITASKRGFVGTAIEAKYVSDVISVFNNRKVYHQNNRMAHL